MDTNGAQRYACKSCSLSNACVRTLTGAQEGVIRRVAPAQGVGRGDVHRETEAAGRN